MIPIKEINIFVINLIKHAIKIKKARNPIILEQAI